MHDDTVLFAHCTSARNGTPLERRAAALELGAFIQRSRICADDVRNHPYASAVIDFFPRHGLVSPCGPLNPRDVFCRLDRRNDRWYDARLEVALRNELGEWPFRLGAQRWSTSAVQAFSYKFAQCSRAPFLSGQERAHHLETIYSSLEEYAAAHQKQRAARPLSMSGDGVNNCVTESAVTRQSFAAMRFRSELAQGLQDPAGPPEGLMAPSDLCAAGYDDDEASDSSDSSSDSAEPDVDQALIICVRSTPESFSMRSCGKTIDLPHSMRQRRATWFDCRGRVFKFRPADWQCEGTAEMAFLAPFVWLFGQRLEQSDYDIERHIAGQGGVLPHDDECHGEFSIPLALARESCARSRRGGARIAIGIRNGPPHLVLWKM